MPELALCEMAAVALVERACGYAKGRTKDDPIYFHEVTEGRDGPTPAQRAKYSSCGDLAHWYLERWGLDEPWVNRASLGHYIVGGNVWELGSSPIHLGSPTDPAWLPRSGDILEIWNTPTGGDAHVCVVCETTPAADTTQPPLLRVGNYGLGGMSPASSPGAGLTTGPLLLRQGAGGIGWYIGHRRIQRIITLESIVARRRGQLNLSGTLGVADDLIDALGARYDAQ